MLDDGLKGLVGHPPQPGEDHVGKARHTCARVLAAVPAGVVINLLSAVKHQTQLYYPMTCTDMMASIGIFHNW